MSRPKKTIPTVYQNIGLPADLVNRVNSELHSEIEGRVPLGARQAFFTKLLRDYFDEQDTAPANGQVGESLLAEITEQY